MASFIQALDVREMAACQRLNRLGRHRWIKTLFATISRLGDGSFWVVLGLAMIAFKGASAALPVLRIAAATIAGVIIYKSLKQTLVRERPYISSDIIELGAAPLDRYSFPSGHTMHAVSLTILMGSAAPPLLLLAVPFTVLVAFSRVILGLHYPSDVLAGATLGASLAMFTLQLI